MRHARPNPIPLPAAVLALSVAVCIGAGAPAHAGASQIERATQAEQREAIEHLLEAIHQAARKLTDRLDGQSALADRFAIRPALALGLHTRPETAELRPAVLPLREALLNLPPPAC